jgi:hypothetical protein
VPQATSWQTRDSRVVIFGASVVGVAACFNARMNNPQPWWLTMPPAELAATILPLFGYQPYEEHMAMANIVTWCKTGRGGELGFLELIVRTGREQFDDPDMRAVAEAIQVLEHAGLLMRSARFESRYSSPSRRGGSIFGRRLTAASFGGGFFVGLTRLGLHALQTNTVRQHLGLSARPHHRPDLGRLR